MNNNPRLGIMLMILTTFIFAIQDGVSRHLAANYNVLTVVMLRYWFFAAFVMMLSLRHAGGLREVAGSRTPLIQILRGVILVVEICLTVLAFVVLGLIETHAVFAVYPLLIAALAGPVLGEYVGWRRRIAIALGLIGVLIILQPGSRVFSVQALVPLAAAFLFALYGLLTRKVARVDSAATSFFYTGVAGAVTITLIAPFWWTPITGWADWTWMGILCATGALGHYLLIKAYEAAEAGTIQPFAYFQLVFVSIFGVTIFGERPETATIVGATLIICAGLYTLIRQARVG